MQAASNRRYYTVTPPLGGTKMQRGMALSSFLLVTSLSVQAVQAVQAQAVQEDAYRYAYLSHVEGEVSLQRASEPEPEPGSLNVPVLPGDRIWTHASSRAEIRFGSGLVVRLSERAKLDFVANDSETILRLWSGSAILAIPAESTEALRVDSPAGIIRPSREGSYRIDVDDDADDDINGGHVVTLSVERGSAELASSLGTVLVQSGETSFATASDPPSIPVKFNTARLDDFDRWSESREVRRARTGDILVRSLPHEVQRYAYDLDDHGDWHQEPDYGSVWYPRVEAGWSPYTYGRFRYTHYGHTWISSEPWGWAPYHYGRWGFGHRGWYWIPGATFGPAWVSFAIGPTWVGWTPLGYHNQPVFAFNSYFGGYGGGYYGRGGYSHYRGGWNVCSQDDFRSGIVTRAGYRRLEPESLRASAENARFVDEVSSLDRELNPRATRLRPASARPGFGEVSQPSSVSRRSEDALRGFRERAAASSPRVIDDTSRTASRRGERGGEVSGIVQRAREIQSALDGRESSPRERAEPARRDRASRSIVRERRAFTERPRTTETPEASQREQSGDAAGPAQTERRERFERLRGDSRESRGTRARTPESRTPETRSETRSRVEQAEPRRGRSSVETPSRQMSGRSRSTRERSSSAGATGGRAQSGGEAAQRTRGSSTPRSDSSRSSGSSGPRGSARARSNQG